MTILVTSTKWYHIGEVNEMMRTLSKMETTQTVTNIHTMKVSDCCQAPMSDPIMEDYSICPECKDHCEFVEENED